MPYYGLSTKEQILAYLNTTLLTITGIQFVDYQRVYNPTIGPDQYPGIFINDLREDKTQVLKDIVKNNFTVALVCWVWALDTESLGTKLNAFIESVKTKVRVDPTCGSKAYSTTVESIATDGGNRHPQGMFIVTLPILFFSEN